MPKLTFVSADGETSQTVDAPDGITLMEAARNAGIDSVAGDCGGACICGTCHIYIDESWMARIGARNDEENELLEELDCVQPNSRLSCQIEFTEDLDGLALTIAPDE